MESAKKAMRGGFFRKPIKLSMISFSSELYAAYNGRMPMKVADRICQPDILVFFGLGVRDGYLCEVDYSPAQQKIAQKISTHIAPDTKLLEEGVQHYRNQNYQKAFTSFSSLAQAGNVNAQQYLGNLYINGQGVTKNPAIAAEWFLKAGKQGHPEAQANIAEMYLSGNGVTQSYHSAYMWAQISLNNGDRAAWDYTNKMHSILEIAAQHLSEAQMLDAMKKGLEASKEYNLTLTKTRTSR